MIQTAKRNGKSIEIRKYETQEDLQQDNWISAGARKIYDVDLTKSYVPEMYCTNFCKKCYSFGCDWDVRCSNNNERINLAVRKCNKFKNAGKLADDLLVKYETDDDFRRFCNIANIGRRRNSLDNFFAIFK